MAWVISILGGLASFVAGFFSGGGSWGVLSWLVVGLAAFGAWVLFGKIRAAV